MTITALRRADADDASLLRRARRGDRRAHRVYCHHHAERAAELAELLVGDGADVAAVAAQLLGANVADGVAGDDALVRCAVRVAAPVTTEDRLARLVVALADGDGRTEEEIAGLVDRPVDQVAELRAIAYADAGRAPARARECRGWPLVARMERVTAPEREAAQGHLALCRPCRARVDEQRHTRDKVWIRGGAVSAVVLADVVSLSLPAGGAVAGSGLASVVLGKAGMAIVGTTALAVTITSAGVAVVRSAPSQPHRARVPAVAPRQPRGGGSSPTAPQPQPDDPSTTTTRGSGRSVAPAPASKTHSTRIVPVPTAAPTGLPTISVPTLPTSVPSLLPLPTPSVPVRLPLPLPSTPPLLGH